MNNKNAWISMLVLSLSTSVSSNPDTPSPVTLITREDIESLTDLTLNDILGSVPTGLGEPGGLNQRGIDNLRGVRILVNGTSVPAPFGAGATHVETHLGPIPIKFIQRVEVLKGPAAATRYGADAVNGVVNFVTNDAFQTYNIFGSYVLNDVQRILGDNWLSIQSKEDCDATNGALLPTWAYFLSHDYGLPRFSNDGSTMYWGSKGSGFDAGSIYIPPSTYQPAADDFVLHIGGGTYVQLGKLLERIRNHPTISAQDKRSYSAALYFHGGVPLGQGLSDQNFELGFMSPDAIYQDFIDLYAGPSPAAATENASDASRTAAAEPESPGLDSDATGATAPGAATETPASGDQPDPFEDYPYPPAYAFDFSRCDEQQKNTILGLISERDQGRADYSYYMDYFRQPSRGPREAQEDFDAARDALDTRDRKNEELRKFWQSCIKGGAAPATQTAEAETPPTSESAPAETPSTGASAQDAAPVIGDDVQLRARLGYSPYPDYNLEFHINRHTRGEDDSVITEPVPDLGIGIHPFRFDLQFRVPFSSGAFRDTEWDAGAGSNRAFTDKNGIARVALSDDFLPVVPGPEVLDFTSTVTKDELLKVRGTFSGRAPLFVAIENPFVAPANGGVGGVSEDSDWQIRLSYGTLDTRGPTFGLSFNYEKVDGIVQEYAGQGGAGMSFNDLRADTLNGIPQFFKDRAGLGFSIGKNWYQPYTFSEYLVPNLNLLDGVPGQTGWTNNFCVDTALPPQGAGYLTAEMSPVKSVDDRWALDRVSVPGSDSLFIEYADPIIVGVIDTGIDWNHLDFAWDNLWRNEDEIPGNGIDDDNNGFVDDIIGWNFTGENNRPWDNDGHGTFVAGIIAATHGNDAGIDGISPNARIMVLKALNNFGRTRASYVAQAIVYGADNGARILNLSVTGPGFPKVVQDAVDYAVSKGVLIIMAAGNRAEDIADALPARLRRVMTVAATGPDDKRAAFSNVGSAINIAAPGVDVVSLRARRTDFMYNSAETTYVQGDATLGDDKRYYRSTGTSFATPIVSGVASLVWGNRPGLTHLQVRRILEQSARDVEIPGRDRFTGYGIVDAQAALAADPEFYIYADIPAVRRIDVDGQTYLQVVGVADADQFARASLELGEGDSPQSWTRIGDELSERVRLDELGRIPAEQLAGAQTWTIRVLVEHRNGRNREGRYVIDLE